MARHVGRFKLGWKPAQLYVRLSNCRASKRTTSAWEYNALCSSFHLVYIFPLRIYIFVSIFISFFVLLFFSFFFFLHWKPERLYLLNVTPNIFFTISWSHQLIKRESNLSIIRLIREHFCVVLAYTLMIRITKDFLN